MNLAAGTALEFAYSIDQMRRAIAARAELAELLRPAGYRLSALPPPARAHAILLARRGGVFILDPHEAGGVSVPRDRRRAWQQRIIRGGETDP